MPKSSQSSDPPDHNRNAPNRRLSVSDTRTMCPTTGHVIALHCVVLFTACILGVGLVHALVSSGPHASHPRHWSGALATAAVIHSEPLPRRATGSRRGCRLRSAMISVSRLTAVGPVPRKREAWSATTLVGETDGSGMNCLSVVMTTYLDFYTDSAHRLIAAI